MKSPEVLPAQTDFAVTTERGRMRFWQKALIISACMILGTIAGAVFFGFLTGASPDTLWAITPHSPAIHTQVTAIRVGLFSGLAGGLLLGTYLTSER